MGLIYSPRFIIFGALGTVLLNQVPVRREDTYGQRQISETENRQLPFLLPKIGAH